MRTTRLAVAAALAFATARAARAQQPTSAVCTYDACALRIEQRFLAPAAIVRGVSGEPVVRFGLFGVDAERAVAGDTVAVRHAREYRRSQRRAIGASVGAVASAYAAFGTCLTLELATERRCGPAAVTGLAAGVGLLVYSGAERLRANRALARAVWWYNRALPR